MTNERAELEQHCARLRSELEAAEARLSALARLQEDPELAALSGDVEALLARTAEVEAALLDGRERLAALSDDLARVQALGGFAE